MKPKFLGYTKDIVVIDNIVSTEKADAWEKHVTNNDFAWYLLRDIISENYCTVNDFFCVFIYSNSTLIFTVLKK